MGMKLNELLEPFKKQKKRNTRLFLSWIAFVIIMVPLGLFMADSLEAGVKWKFWIGVVGFITDIVFFLKHGDLIQYYFNSKEVKEEE